MRLNPKIRLIPFTFFLLPLLVLGSILMSCGQNSAEEANIIRIGEFGSLTGPTATFGQSTAKGVDMALEKINQSGGVLGKQLKLFREDDQGKPEESITAVTKLINKDRVVAVLGQVASSNTIAAAPVAQQNRIPLVTPASTNPKVTEIGDYIFRICFIDPFQGAVMAKFAYNSLGLRKIAILRDVKSDYSMGLANFFTQNFEALGGTIVANESYSAGDKDFGAQLTTIRAVKPEGVFVPGYYTEVGLIARQANTLGLNAVLLGGDGWDSAKLWEIGGTALNGSYYSNHYSAEDPNPIIQAFVEEFRAKYKEEPDAMSALGYDAAMILADAIGRAGNTGADNIKAALATTREYQGITGNISLDEHRNALKSAVVLEFNDGVARYKETVNP